MPTMDRDDLLIEDFVKKQIEKWKKLYSKVEPNQKAKIPVITLCMEPGSGGCVIAEQVAKRLDFDFFHRNIIHKISASVRISATVVESLEKDRLSGVQDFISSIIKDQYIHPNLYLEHLMKVVGTIGKHGQAVVVGRGANFIIPPKDRFAVRVIAPMEQRIGNVVERFGVPSDEAKRRVMVRENRRRAFVRQSFNADICDPMHYELLVNTGNMSIDAGVEAIIGSVLGRLTPTK